MAEHTATFSPGEKLTLTAGADVTGGQLVAVTGDNEVKATSTASGAWLGVAANDADTDAHVTVLCGGVHELAADGSIAAGADVIPAAAGKVKTAGSTEDYSAIVGVALAKAANNKVLVKLAR